MAFLRAVRGLGAIAALAALATLGLAPGPVSRPCGFRPDDWCPAPAGDACGRHHAEGACRDDPGCRGLPYRGESVVACIPDAQGFWSNCPAVGCIARSDPPGQPPRREVVAEICGSPRAGGQTAAEVRVWRTVAKAATILELRTSSSGRPWSLFYDTRGHFLHEVPTHPEDTPAGRFHAEVRAAVLTGLGEAESVACPAHR
ncbi:MAG TPA: hypothetical protein VKY89_01715 [Thermoanaerobaculia bacterium]|jgi:hypothetical protein|nr:hypothetical protein [Thermoanaerobaculia bacterium]